MTRPKTEIHPADIRAIADAVGRVAYINDRVRVARSVIPVLKAATGKDETELAAIFRDEYLTRTRDDYRILNRSYEDDTPRILAHADRYYRLVLGLKPAQDTLPTEAAAPLTAVTPEAAPADAKNLSE